MRFRDIQNSHIRNSALSQYADQLGVSQAMKHTLKDCYVSLLDYYETVEGFEYWNTIRPLYLLDTGSNTSRHVFSPNEDKYFITDNIKKLLKENKKPNSYLWEYFGFSETSIKKVLKGSHVGMYFINLMCLHFKIDRSELIGSNNIDRFEKPKPRKDQTTKIPKGTKRVCSTCKKEKDLSKGFNNFKYGKLGKSNNCKICNRARQKEYKKKARLKKLKK